jgi:hypothetical protein
MFWYGESVLPCQLGCRSRNREQTERGRWPEERDQLEVFEPCSFIRTYLVHVGLESGGLLVSHAGLLLIVGLKQGRS